MTFDIGTAIDGEAAAHLNFFQETSESGLDLFAMVLKASGNDRLEYWRTLGLEPHFLPPMTIDQDIPGWENRLNPQYQLAVAGGGILLRRDAKTYIIDRNALALNGVVVLIDTRLKPDLDPESGRASYAEDDLLGPVIAGLRQGGVISDFPSQQRSRFRITPDEWENYVRPALADKLTVSTAKVRLERVIEANVIPQLFPCMPRVDDARTDSWVWFEEFFRSGQNRILGMASVLGGYRHLTWAGRTASMGFVGIRPIIVLA